MVLINNEDFKIYLLDNLESILNRLASKFNTLPRYLYFPKGEPNIEDFQVKINNIEVEDILNIIKTENKNDDISILYKKIKDKNTKLESKELIQLIILYNSLVNSIPRDTADSMLFYFTYINKAVFSELSVSNTNIDNFFDNLQGKINTYNERIEYNKKLSENKERELLGFENKVGVSYNKFILHTIFIEFDIKYNKQLLEIFDNVVLSKKVPFASCDEFYKIYNGTQLYEEWKETEPDTIMLKILQVNMYENPEYTTVKIFIDKDTEKTKVLLAYNTIDTVPQTEIISRFLDIFPNINKDNFILEREQKGISGIIEFNDQRLNRYIFSDMAMNNPVFSSFLTIDESVIGKKSTVFVHFDTPETGKVTAFLTEQFEDIDKNIAYVRAKLNARDEKSMLIFADIMSKLFTQYNDQYDEVLRDYLRYLLITELEIKTAVPKKRQDNKYDDIFVLNYSRFCSENPTEISDEEEEIYKSKGKQVLIFPKDDSMGYKPKKYICNHKRFPFPGVRSNTLPNSDKFPFLPCCFAVNQQNKAEYRHYYYGEDLADTNFDQYIIKTNKLLNKNQIGYLPRKIQEFFAIVDDNLDYVYYRLGVSQSPNSFLSCVLLALYNKEENVEQKRKELISDTLLPSVKQEMYDYSTEKITEIIKNQDEYLDPKYFIHLLEVKYNCNIFLFTINDEYPEGTLVIPRHNKGYFKMKNMFENTIFIYEHKDDSNKKPYCELVLKWDKKGKKDDLQYKFESKSDVINNAFKIFEQFNEFNILNNTFELCDIDLSKFNIFSQVIDNYGKTRVLNIEYKDNKISLFTSPLQPIGVREENSENIYKVSNDIVEEFIKDTEIQVIDRSDIAYNCVTGNTLIKIYLQEKTQMIVEKSVLSSYNMYKKLSRYILQYFFWLYSKYLNENSKLPDIDNFSDFERQYVVIDENFEYSNNIPIEFSINNILFRGNKLVIKSSETLLRLFYGLKLKIMQQPQKIHTFYTRKTIDNYYIDADDFLLKENQLILKGSELFSRFIQSNLINNINSKLHSDIYKDALFPYFFRNKLINNNVYLAQNTFSLEKAIQIHKIWKTDRYNSLYNPEVPEGTNEKKSVILYSYKDKNTIKPYLIAGKGNPIPIIVYQIIEGEEVRIFYTVLLHLSGKKTEISVGTEESKE